MSEEGIQDVYADERPDIARLVSAYEHTVNDNETFFTQCRDNADWRYNKWPGKSADLRKNAEGAFPWKGASDQEANTIGERLDTFVEMGMNALDRSHSKAFPTKMTGLPMAQAVGTFVKWLQTDGIPEFRVEMERTWNHGLEKDIMITYVGWKSESRTRQQIFTLEELAAQSPELADMVAVGDDDEGVAALLEEGFKVSRKRAMKAVRDLREKQQAVLSVAVPAVQRPEVESCLPDGEVFLPSWCGDPQRSPYIFRRTLLTEQEIRKRVVSDGWNEEWADYVIENCKGKGTSRTAFAGGVQEPISDRSSTNTATTNSDELFEVVYAYERLIDKEDGSEGIWCTVFSAEVGEDDVAQDYASRNLWNGWDDYPFVFTRMREATKRFYDVRAMPEMLKGPQWVIKKERDSRIDRNGMTTLPELTGPPGREPSQRGPGRYIPVRRTGEYSYLGVPGTIQGSMEVEQVMEKMADRAVGLDYELPNAPIRQQFKINKLLRHACEVLRLAYKCYQRFGPDEIFFHVTGSPDPVTLQNIEEEDFNLVLSFDTLSSDPETMKARMENMAMLFPLDTTGRLDRGKYIEFAAYSISPEFADYVLLPADEASAKLERAITDDFAKLYSGVAVGPQPNGAQVTMQKLQMWMQEPDVAERLQNDEAFAKRVQDYAKQAQMILMQAENAQTGKLGTAPTAFQGSNIQ